MKKRLILLSGVFAGLASLPAAAKVSPQEAQELGGPRLTAFGAERAGNADGSIPAYTGPLTLAAAGVTVPESGRLPDPFASEKPILVINAQNIGQYGDSVPAGIAGALRKYPTFHLNVYPTHRTAGYPDWVLANIKKNAVNAELVGSIEGDGITGAYGGVAFPIPKNGYEVIWNTYTSWAGIAVREFAGGDYFVDASGTVTLTNRTEADFNYPYYDPTKTEDESGYYVNELVTSTAPAAQDGEKNLIELPLNYGTHDQVTYTYTLGQRRVRLAPEFKYDTPIAANGGAFTFDEIGMFEGRLDRFDFKLVGKRDMYIPYNNYKFNQPGVTAAEWMPLHHPNPDLIRWEKHRVWVVDATLKPGAHHIYSRRTFYVDEDTWDIVATDAYDHGDQLYRVGMMLSYPQYNAPYPVTYGGTDVYLNLERGNYALTQFLSGNNDGHIQFLTHELSSNMFSPELMAGTGIR